jgi:hypothetical protein
MGVAVGRGVGGMAVAVGGTGEGAVVGMAVGVRVGGTGVLVGITVVEVGA